MPKPGVCLLFFFNLFIYGCTGTLLLRAGFLELWQVGAALHCSAWASHCGASLVAEHGLESSSSVAATPGLSCSVACGLFPHQESTCVVCISRQILNPWTTREDLC